MKLLNSRIFWERRKTPRVNSSLTINYQIPNDTLSSTSITQDISEGGIRLHLFQKLTVGGALKLGIYLQDRSEPAWVFGKVVWVKETPGSEYPYEAGIQFSLFDPSFRSRIHSYIQNISSEKK